MPVARHRARAPAIVRPWVEVRERRSGITTVCHCGDRDRPPSPQPGTGGLPKPREIRHSVSVHSPSGVELAGLASLVVAVPAVAVLANSGRKHTGAARRAFHLLAAGSAIVAAAGLAGVISAIIEPHHSPDEPRMLLGTTMAVAMALGTTTLLAGTVLLPGSGKDRGTILRNLCDGAIIAAALCFVGWVLIAWPTEILGGAYICLSMLIPAVVGTLAVGLTVVLGLHAHRPRNGTVRVALGVTTVAISALLLS